MSRSVVRLFFGFSLLALLATGCAPSALQTVTPAASRESSPPAAPSASATSSFSTSCGVETSGEAVYSKPVIYLYPPRTMKVSVHLAVSGVITHTDPAIGPTNTWQVVALPDGVLLDSVGRSFPYLFWEADASSAFDMSTGFVVSGADTRLFLATKLNALGLSAREAESFVDYWLPRMKANPYNLIHFEGPAYEQSARLSVSPVPDTQIRVFMVFRSLQTPVSVTAQTLPAPAPRRGFTLVEWGGTELIGR